VGVDELLSICPMEAERNYSRIVEVYLLVRWKMCSRAVVFGTRIHPLYSTFDRIRLENIREKRRRRMS
jgi:hypothetical protein